MDHPTRRRFLKTAAATLAVSHDLFAAGDKPKASLAGEVGITTSSLSGHLVRKPVRGKFTLLELPRILRDELDMRVIDLNTSSLVSFEPKYLEKVRKSAADAGCHLTNLKLNQRCFRIGWKAGFRGPWCLEHANAERKLLFRELAMLRDLLRKWTKSPTS